LYAENIHYILDEGQRHRVQHDSTITYRFKQAVREAATIYPTPVTMTFDLLTLKVVSESRVTCATSEPILVFLGLSVLDLGPMYATDVRQTSDVRCTSSLNAPAYGAGA